MYRSTAESSHWMSQSRSKGHNLVVGGLDAAALGGDLVVADGQHGAAVAALHHGVDQKAGDDHAKEHVGEVGVLGDVLQALWP